MKNNNSLTTTELLELVPSAFAGHQSPKVSNKYTFISTATVLHDMERLGWEPFSASQRKSRKDEDSMFTKHMIRLRNNEVGKIGDSIPEVVLTNSHDGRNAFTLHAGLFRLVCSNGLVIADTTFEQVKIKHQWYNFEEIRKIMDNMLEVVPKVITQVQGLNEITLNDQQQVDFASKALLTRYPKGNENLNVEDLLSPVRQGDRGDQLWKIFNVVQEKLIKGGLVFNNKKEKMQKLRPIINIDRRIDVNKKLWELTEAYV
tara:strand:+ start:4432 stop:5208 length:777 start_codon:yes stop_codon:yes gene_type:complete